MISRRNLLRTGAAASLGAASTALFAKESLRPDFPGLSEARNFTSGRAKHPSDILPALGKRLESLGWTVRSSARGLSAVNFTGEGAYDLILSGNSGTGGSLSALWQIVRNLPAQTGRGLRVCVTVSAEGKAGDADPDSLMRDCGF